MVWCLVRCSLKFETGIFSSFSSWWESHILGMIWSMCLFHNEPSSNCIRYDTVQWSRYNTMSQPYWKTQTVTDCVMQNSTHTNVPRVVCLFSNIWDLQCRPNKFNVALTDLPISRIYDFRSVYSLCVSHSFRPLASLLCQSHLGM